MSKYIDFKKFDIANGDGIRHSIWFAGCSQKCKGCFSESTWDFTKGKNDWDSMLQRLFESMNDYIDGISILGGDPLDKRNIERCLWLCREFKKKYPNKTIWVWTGRILEELEFLDEVYELIDVVVDGRFVEDLKDLSLKYRGSSNQRVIYLKGEKYEKKI